MRNRFQTLHTVLNLLGSLFIVLGFLLIVPFIFSAVDGEISQGHVALLAFLLPSGLAFALGIICRYFFRSENVGNLQAMLVCSLGWIGFSAIGALPFVILIRASYVDGLFETMSGFTTTGITMFSGLDEMPRSILFWRSLTQWIGGLGILTFFLAVIFRGTGAHSLFGAESHKVEMRRPVPGLANTVKVLWGIYGGFTLLIAGSLFCLGMPLFDSVCHSFTALSTGGFSPHDASIGYYSLAGHTRFVWIEYVLILGMILGGTNFLIHYRVLKRDWKSLFDNDEIRYWWGFIALFVAVIFIENVARTGPGAHLSSGGSDFWRHIEERFRMVLFQVVSIITTTGFGTRDIGGPFFGHAAKQLFLVMMVIGGCVGSTGGGLKVLRVAVLVKLIRREIERLIAPRRSISTLKIDGKAVDADQVHRVSALFFTWVGLLVVGGVITALLSNFDSYSAFSGMFSALGNIGPCYIPTDAMGQLNPVIKVTYILGMLAGRLEILPVLLLLSPKAWRS
jgi:trk system potassium uptake protein TrkH